MSETEIKTAAGDTVIGINSVSKAFSMRWVLRSVDLSIEKGQTVCLCGVNGAGKSTLLRIISGLLHPDHGSVTINGFDVSKEPEKTKPQFGVISHKSMVYPELTVFENLQFFANLYGVKNSKDRIKELLEEVGLFPFRYDNAAVLSRGLLQRLSIARAMVHEPSVLLADEPFTGLDSEACRHLVKVLTNFRTAGGTVIMTTHDTNLGLQSSSRVVVLDENKLIFDSPVSQLDTADFTADYLSYARKQN
jgi:heme ABC exporter ATP-binding subunit CcmA